MSNATQQAQAEFLMRELVVLRTQMDAVQLKLDGAEIGLRGWWRGSLSPGQFQTLTRERAILLETIAATRDEVKSLLAPTNLEKLKLANALADEIAGGLARLSTGCVACWSALRWWSRLRYAPLKVWHWRMISRQTWKKTIHPRKFEKAGARVLKNHGSRR